MAANKTIGGINVTITATTEKFAKGITQARKLTTGFSSQIKGLVFNMKTLGGVLAAGAFTKLVADQYEAIGTMKDLSDKTGIAVEDIGGLELVAREAGISMSVMEKALVKLNNETGMQGDKALRAWIEKTAKLTTQQERLAAATEMFGSRGSDMVRLLVGGVAAFDETRKAAEKMGLSISAETAAGVDRASESFQRLKDNTVGIFRTMAAESYPYLQALADGTQNLINDAGGGKAVGKFIVDVLANMAKGVLDLIQSMVDTAMMAFFGLQEMVVGFRSSAIGEAMGVGYGSGVAEARAQGGLMDSYDRTKEFINRPRWSKGIDDLVNAATAAAAKAVKDAALTGPGLFDGLGDAAKKYGMGSLQSWQGAGMGLWGAASGGFNKMAMKAGAMEPAKMAASQTPALAFAESGSVESYRQQAAIRRQGDQIAKKQLNVQEKMEGHLSQMKGLLNFAPANLGKG